MTDELLMEVVAATNAYATTHISRIRFTNNSVWYIWIDVTLPKPKAYLGGVLKIAIIEKSNVKDYFSRAWAEYCPFFLDIFSRQFLQIHWMLHANSPEPTTGP